MQGGKVKGREVENVKLSTALANRETGVFTTEEWISFGLSDTQQDDFIQVGDSYFVVQAVQGLPDVMPSRISCAYQCKMGYFEHRHPDTGAAACYTCIRSKEPFPPFTDNCEPSILMSTPLGRATGLFATRDISLTLPL